MGTLHLLSGDITQLAVDGIVNAANQSLLGGGGVDGAIHRAAGPELLEACRALGGCLPGEAKLTPGYRLPARFVIHTVGPIWRGGAQGEAQTLRCCYRSCLQVAEAHGLRTLAFPSISTGAYRYPLEQAARVAVEELRVGLAARPELDITVVCFLDEVRLAYESILRGEPGQP